MNRDSVQNVLNRLEGVKQTGPDQWEACCPAHDDAHASLSIGRGDDGRVLLHCQAGCKTENVLSKLNLTFADLCPNEAAEQDVRKLSPPPSFSPAPSVPEPIRTWNRQPLGSVGTGGKIVATYPYHSADGKLLFEAVRFDPKEFCQRRPDGKGRWIWNLDGVQRVLYRLPELLSADPAKWVFVVEGEKDVDNVRALGLVATCNPVGAGKWGKLADDSALYGRRVCIIADKDKPNSKTGRIRGREHAEDVAQRLYGKAATVRNIELPGDGKDASDWIESRDGCDPGELAAALLRMAEDAPEWMPKADTAPGPVLICMADVEPREVRWLWLGRVPLGRITLLVGRPGESKSLLTTYMAARVSTGMPWPDGQECPAGSVILISAEDGPNDTIRPRLDANLANVRKVHLMSAVRRTSQDGQLHEVMFTLADVANLELALKELPDCRLIVVDPIGSFLGGKTDAHRDNEVRSILAPVAKLAEKYGPAVLVVAHTRKSAGSFADDLALGSRAFTGIARAVWHVTRDSNSKDRRLLLPGKNNLAAESTGLAFSIIGTPPAIAWEPAPVAMTADEALAVQNCRKEDSKPGPEPEALNQAADWLAAELADLVERPVKKLREDAEAAGLNWRSVQRASNKLGVRVYRAGFGGGCVWQLPTSIHAKPVENGEYGTNGTNAGLQGKPAISSRQECHTRQVDSLGTNGRDDAAGRRRTNPLPPPPKLGSTGKVT